MSLTALTALTALAALAPSWLETVRRASSGRGAHTLFGGHEHVMRQTVIAPQSRQGLEAAEDDSAVLLTVAKHP